MRSPNKKLNQIKSNENFFETILWARIVSIFFADTFRRRFSH
ncbi:MAG: hypothetical protein AVDCRST_MAG74-2908 [uncultured Pyrinomonadaceae bacterium]|uniref:Uncharacterized protein n=1 Tax=uncultured Pyrinomonadaceae bacterium TaxID=2283094 RepID=A0A6J4PUR1_9BACT|nr:MAG: hypothetical protein AVDCRST_MAG74-2908 [uncultured Pyrinomonadaceae bacterium]